MLDKVLKTIQRYDMIAPGDKVLVGVSGGADSTALLHALKMLQTAVNMEIFVVHVHHGLRGEAADEDAHFVEELCRNWSIPFYLKKANVRQIAGQWGVSEEEAGRSVRYSFFDEVLTGIQGQKIALAHHQDDQAETILHNIIRGTGLKGLGGMKPIRDGKYIRPFLEVSRSEILNYCTIHCIAYQEDASNNDLIYTRNRIRHQLIPMIEEQFNPDFKASLTRMSEIIREDEAFLSQYCRQLYEEHVGWEKNTVKIPLPFLLGCPLAVQRRLVRLGLEKFNQQLSGIQHVHVDAVLKAAKHSKTGAVIKLPGRISAFKNYDALEISRDISSEAVSPFWYQLDIPGEVYIPELDVRIWVREAAKENVYRSCRRCIYIDRDQLQGKLAVRSRRNGDRFKPFGMKGTKKLSDYFIDQKIPKNRRDKIPLVVDESNIVWVAGCQIHEDYKINQNTQNVIELGVDWVESEALKKIEKTE